ncbi:Lrp/AsnC family transcriptional regulator [Actinomycetes bacterium KLBMP 9797]
MDLDTVDRQLIHALRVDGRAGFNQIARVLGVSDQTVARRYRRLRAAGGLRVVARPNPWRLGHEVWLLRLRCTPDAATAVANALAKRPDTAWISLTSGGTEIACMLTVDGTEDRDALLLRKLPGTPRVVAVTAHLHLHLFAGGPHDRFARPAALSPEQVTQLAAPSTPEPDPELAAERAALDEADTPLIAALAQDGRSGYPELARATGWSESTVRRRLDQLRRSATIYFDVEVDPALLGFHTRVMLWLSVQPRHLAAAGEALAQHPEVVFAAAITGPSNLVATVVCPDAPTLYRYLTDRIGALPGVERVESAPNLRTLKQVGPLP